MTGKIAATGLTGTVLCAVYLLSMPSGARAAPSEPANVSTEAPAAPPQSNAASDLPQFALAGPKGFGFASKDGSFSLITHWLLQPDFRGFLTETPSPDSSTFIVRFAGLRLDASLYQRLHTQVFVNFAESRVTLLDAFIDAELFSWLRLRVGKFPFPISEERLTPGTNLPFVSTSPASFLQGQELRRYRRRFWTSRPRCSARDLELGADRRLCRRRLDARAGQRDRREHERVERHPHRRAYRRKSGAAELHHPRPSTRFG